ncbi:MULTISPECIES: hypothetical protein [Moorena]|nr:MULTISPECIES: hypothetical protein [Moorena]NEP30764.1 hypothetical protein [Moorena sp. SIO3B2]NEP65179.1 hypothetical protein [Moorena sp. SIO3A5]NEQ15790.1 hypothetical protein [Moorena sp. SIO3E2]
MGRWGGGEMGSVGDHESIAVSSLIRYTGFFHYSLFPIPDSRFPTPDSRFPILNSKFAHSKFPIPDSRFPIPDSRF